MSRVLDRYHPERFDAERYTPDNIAYWSPIFVMHLQARPEHVVLDVGCGTGGFTQAIANETGARVIGVERNASLLSHAQQHRAGPNCEWHRASAEALPLGEGSVDRVVASLILHQLERPNDLLTEAARVLKPNGRLVVRTVEPEDAAVRAPFRFFPTVAEAHRNRMPDLAAIQRDASVAGFDHVVTDRVVRHKRLDLQDEVAKFQRDAAERYPFLSTRELAKGIQAMEVAAVGDWIEERPFTFLVFERR